MYVPGLRTASTFFSSARLISRFSTTASMIQSHSGSFARSSSKFPMLTSLANSALVNAAGFDFFRPSSPALANLFRAARSCDPAASGGTISRSKQGIPALARCAAMRAPMVPAPRTATLLIFLCTAERALSDCGAEGEVDDPFPAILTLTSTGEEGGAAVSGIRRLQGMRAQELAAAQGTHSTLRPAAGIHMPDATARASTEQSTC